MLALAIASSPEWVTLDRGGLGLRETILLGSSDGYG